jgi:phosphoenolpyruvate-protein kinase (PTS system EI component)
MLKFVVDEAARANVPLSVCGEMAADPRSLEWLIGLGLREISLQPRSIGQARASIAAIDSDEAARLAGLMAEGTEAQAIEKVIETALPDVGDAGD